MTTKPNLFYNNAPRVYTPDGYHPYTLILPLEATHYDGLFEKLVHDDHYELSLVYDKWTLRSLNYLSGMSTVKTTHILEIIELVDKLIRNEDRKLVIEDTGEIDVEVPLRFSKLQIKAIYEIFFDLFLAAEVTQQAANCGDVEPALPEEYEWTTDHAGYRAQVAEHEQAAMTDEGPNDDSLGEMKLFEAIRASKSKTKDSNV